MANSSASEGEALVSVGRYVTGRLIRGGRFVFEIGEAAQVHGLMARTRFDAAKRLKGYSPRRLALSFMNNAATITRIGTVTTNPTASSTIRDN